VRAPSFVVVVVTELCYKPEGRRFETRCGEWISLTYLMVPAALGSGVYSASKTHEAEAEKYCLWGVERGRSVGLTTLPPSVSRLSRVLDSVPL
jgi:hypothetical protein